jgi:hypothetical protein
MPDFTDDFEDGEAGLIDERAIHDILEKATDALRGIGLTIRTQEVTITVQQGQVYALIPALIRPSAKKKLVEDEESRKAFNTMMAADNDARIRAEAERIREAAMDPAKLEELLYGDPEVCAHTNQHEGLCLDCQEAV